MARRYDTRTTTFSPEGRLYQVEYAMEAINNAGAAIGVRATDGVVLAAEKKITSKLLDTTAVGVKREKLYRIDDHIACVVAGITADANILVSQCRLVAQQHRFAYGQPIPVEQLVRGICDRKQLYTQFGGQRPFGVSILYAGWDEEYGFQLIQSDPSGNFGGWKATAIGANNQAATNILKTEYKDDTELSAAVPLMARVLAKSMDTALTTDKVEMATMYKDKDTGEVVFEIYTEQQLQPLLEKANEEKEAEGTT